MPEEKESGILVDPTGDAEALSRKESATLSACLRILREGDTSALYDALEAIVEVSAELGSYPEHAEVIRTQISKFLYNNESLALSDHPDARGVLGGQMKSHPLQILAADELEILGFTVTAIRRVGWFKAGLDLQVHAIATNHLPGDRHPSPLQIASSLTLAITEWEDQLNAAKQFAERRPDLLFPVMRREGDPSAEPATVPRPVSTTTKPKPRRARKGHAHKAA